MNQNKLSKKNEKRLIEYIELIDNRIIDNVKNDYNIDLDQVVKSITALQEIKTRMIIEELESKHLDIKRTEFFDKGMIKQ